MEQGDVETFVIVYVVQSYRAFSFSETQEVRLIENSGDMFICLGSGHQERGRRMEGPSAEKGVVPPTCGCGPRKKPQTEKKNKKTFPSLLLRLCLQSTGDSGSPQHPNECRSL